MVSYLFNKDLGLLEAKFEADVVVSEVADYIISTKENKTYPRDLKIITDATSANFKFSPSDLNILIEENYKSIEKYDFITDAIILENPKNTALSMLFGELVKTNKYRFNVFSTRDAALNWLKTF